jgi:hypothetical protein
MGAAVAFGFGKQLATAYGSSNWKSLPRKGETMENREQNPNEKRSEQEIRTMDAVRHVGPTLESKGLFIPTGGLPENRIENEGLTEVVNVRVATEDAYDREAEAMGGEAPKTRMPGDQSSDPHTDVDPDNAMPTDDDAVPLRAESAGVRRSDGRRREVVPGGSGSMPRLCGGRLRIAGARGERYCRESAATRRLGMPYATEEKSPGKPARASQRPSIPQQIFCRSENRCGK